MMDRHARQPPRRPRAGRIARWLSWGLLAALAGCAELPQQRKGEGEEPEIAGPAPRRNFTPLDGAFACLAGTLQARGVPAYAIAVGEVRDYTGKFSQAEGNAVTQGGALMVYSALGKLGPAIQLQERLDTRIAEAELAYTDRRQLGDGRTHAVEPGKPPVQWVPYFGGSILRSHYYLIGGITELNYNIASGGFEANLSGAGAKSRTFTMNVGVDLRIVDTRTLLVAGTASLQKHIVGREVGAGIFRFFGNELLDISVGSKKQEPLQLGIRTALEQGVLELVGRVAGIDPAGCIHAALHGGVPVPAARAVVPVEPLRLRGELALRAPSPTDSRGGE